MTDGDRVLIYANLQVIAEAVQRIIAIVQKANDRKVLMGKSSFSNN
jgi:hypothetical protein